MLRDPILKLDAKPIQCSLSVRNRHVSFWLILLSAKEVRILRPHRAGPAAETIHMEIQRRGARVNAQWGVNMQQRIILLQAFIEQLMH